MDPQRGSRTYRNSIVKKTKKKRRWIYVKCRRSLKMCPQKGSRIYQSSIEGDEEEEEVDINVEADLRTDHKWGAGLTEA